MLLSQKIGLHLHLQGLLLYFYLVSICVYYLAAQVVHFVFSEVRVQHQSNLTLKGQMARMATQMHFSEVRVQLQSNLTLKGQMAMMATQIKNQFLLLFRYL